MWDQLSPFVRAVIGGSRALQNSITFRGINDPELSPGTAGIGDRRPPPVEPRVPELPFEQLSWRDFERLVFRLARTDADVVYCAPYGRSGQAQHGIDVYARLAGGGHICWQAKNRKDVRRVRHQQRCRHFLKANGLSWQSASSIASKQALQTARCKTRSRHRPHGFLKRHPIRSSRRNPAQRKAEVPSEDRRRLFPSELAGRLCRRGGRGGPETAAGGATRHCTTEPSGGDLPRTDPTARPGVERRPRSERNTRYSQVLRHPPLSIPVQSVPRTLAGPGARTRRRPPGSAIMPGSSTNTATPANPLAFTHHHANCPSRLRSRSTTGCCRATARCCSPAHPALARARFSDPSRSTWCRHRNCSPRSMTGSVSAYHCSSRLHSGAVSRPGRTAKWGCRR